VDLKLFKAKLKEMMVVQEALNSQIATDWKEKGPNWPIDVWLNCGELIERMRTHWCKKANLVQSRADVVDVWRYILSDGMRTGQNFDFLVNTLVDEVLRQNRLMERLGSEKPVVYIGHYLEIKEKAEKLAHSLLSSLWDFNARCIDFVCICHDLGIDFWTLHAMYMGKNTVKQEG